MLFARHKPSRRPLLLLITAVSVFLTTSASGDTQTYPLLCRGGVQFGLHIVLGQVTQLRFYFQPATQAASPANLPLAHCGWLDRAMQSDEPHVVCISAGHFGINWHSPTGEILAMLGDNQTAFDAVNSLKLEDSTYTFHVFNDGAGCLRVPGGDQYTSASLAAPLQQTFPLVCRGGRTMTVGVDGAASELYIFFHDAALAGTNGQVLSTGQCAWKDRSFRDKEPRKLCQTFKDLHEQWWKSQQIEVSSQSGDARYVDMLGYEDRYVEFNVFGDAKYPGRSCLRVVAYHIVYPP